MNKKSDGGRNIKNQ